MSNQAIGMIETRGYVPALASADAMVKAANVELVSKNEVGGGLVSVVIKGDEMGYAEGSGVTLISEDGMFRSPGVPFATVARADLPDDVVKAIVAAYIESLPELKTRSPYAANVNYDVVDAEVTGLCNGLSLKYHPGAVAAWVDDPASLTEG